MRATPPLTQLAGTLFALLLCMFPPASRAGSAAEARATAPASAAAPDLSSEDRARMLEAAADPALPGWQREVMQRVANSQPVAGGPAQPAVAEAPSSSDGSWSGLTPQGRNSFSVIYDAARNRMVLFGGQDGAYYNDTWALLLEGTPHWLRLLPGGTLPPARMGHTAIYDPVRDHMIVFGGYNGSDLSDVWQLSLAEGGAWTQQFPTGTNPGPRGYASAVYDPASDTMLLLCGRHGSTYYNDVWRLSLAATPMMWTSVGPSGVPPAPRDAQSAIYDPTRGRIVIFGGYSPIFRRDVWALTLGPSPGWSELQPTGSLPRARAYAVAVYDAPNDRMLVFGGDDSTTYRHDTWQLAFSGTPMMWTELLPSGVPPAGRSAPGAVIDPVAQRMVLFGGGPVVKGSTVQYDDTWAMTLNGTPVWTNSITEPGTRESPSVIYDPLRRRMILFGGYTGSTYLNDTWALSLVGSPAWAQLNLSGTPPTPRYQHRAVYDPVRDRMLVFGGRGASVTDHNDVLSLDLAAGAWSLVTPGGTPPTPRTAASMIYDPVRDRLVVFGGYSGGAMNDTWELTLATGPTWNHLTPSGAPSARYGATAIYDPVRDQMVLFSGSGGTNDVWALPLAGGTSWSHLPTLGTPPSARLGHSAVYDPARDRMVIFGGAPGYTDAYELALATNYWTTLTPELAPTIGWSWFYHSAIYDPVHDRMVLAGSATTNYVRNNTWFLMFGATLAVPVPAPGGTLSMARAVPNPARGGVTIGFSLARPASASLRVYDVTGRAMRTLINGPRPAGAQSVRWDLRLDSGERAKPGLYFYELRVGSQRMSRRVTVVD